MKINYLTNLLDLFPNHQHVIEAALMINADNFTNGTTEFGDDRMILSTYYTHKYSTQAESHQVYTDIQFLIEGVEVINYYLRDQVTTTMPYNSNHDVELYSIADDRCTAVYLQPGMFVSFTPAQIHQPGLRPNNLPLSNQNQVKKVVLKLKQ